MEKKRLNNALLILVFAIIISWIVNTCISSIPYFVGGGDFEEALGCNYFAFYEGHDQCIITKHDNKSNGTSEIILGETIIEYKKNRSHVVIRRTPKTLDKKFNLIPCGPDEYYIITKKDSIIHGPFSYQQYVDQVEVMNISPMLKLHQ